MTTRNAILRVLSLAFALGCVNGCNAADVEVAHPVLRTETLTLLSTGHVTKLKGRVLMLEKARVTKGYKEVKIGDAVNDGDILTLEKLSSIEIVIANSSKTVVLSSDKKSRWFTVEIKRPQSGDMKSEEQ